MKWLLVLISFLFLRNADAQTDACATLFVSQSPKQQSVAALESVFDKDMRVYAFMGSQGIAVSIENAKPYRRVAFGEQGNFELSLARALKKLEPESAAENYFELGSSFEDTLGNTSERLNRWLWGGRNIVITRHGLKYVVSGSRLVLANGRHIDVKLNGRGADPFQALENAFGKILEF